MILGCRGIAMQLLRYAECFLVHCYIVAKAFFGMESQYDILVHKHVLGSNEV